MSDTSWRVFGVRLGPRPLPPLPVPESAALAGSVESDPSVASSTSKPSAWLAALGRRAASAFVLIPIVIALAWFGGWVAFGGVLVILLLGAWELRDMFAHRGWRPLIFLSVALSLDFLLAAMLRDQRSLLLEGGISALVIGSFAWLMITRPTIERTLVDWALTLAIPFYLGWPLAFILLLRGDQIGYLSRGFWWLLVMLLTIWANDTAALLTGHYFGRHKLAPHISPGKTWEGFVGGLVVSVVSVFVVTTLADHVLSQPLHLAWYHTLLIGIFIAITATIGDLAESLLKRGTGVKDSGHILPGHGGILDRADSMLFAVYIVFFYALLLGVLH
jgi:phosphatidate cytidylyltransferase